MLIIGLTGGIGSGKSTVADLFKKLGAPVIDTDEISRQLVQQGQPALGEICAAFDGVLTADGSLDRAKLRQLIFNDDKKRIQLETILHPKIQQEVKQQLAQSNYAYTIVVIPLLTEKGKWSFIDRVLVVDCDEQLQLQRTMQRDNQSKQQINSILEAQASRQQRLDIADDVIINESDLSHLEKSVALLDKKYREFTAN